MPTFVPRADTVEALESSQGMVLVYPDRQIALVPAEVFLTLFRPAAEIPRLPAPAPAATSPRRRPRRTTRAAARPTSRGNLSEAQLGRARAAWTRGDSATAIGKAVGKGPTWAYGAAKANGWPARGTGPTGSPRPGRKPGRKSTPAPSTGKPSIANPKATDRRLCKHCLQHTASDPCDHCFEAA